VGTPQPFQRSPDSPWGDQPPPARPDVVVIGEAQEAPSQTTFDDLRTEAASEDALIGRIAPVLRALDRGVERTRKEGEAEARRIVAAARDEAARIRKSVEDELVAAHLGLEQLRARRDEAIQQLRALYDHVVSTSEQMAPDVSQDEDRSAEVELPPPPDTA